MNCTDCQTPISRYSKGRCRPCSIARLNSDPTINANRVAGIKRKYATDPVYRARKIREIGQRHKAARLDPATAARLNLNIWIARERLNDPGVREKFLAGRKEAGMKRTRTVLSWCPPDRIEEYRRLCKSKRLPAEEAKRIILESLTPFEKQLMKVMAGASISTVVQFNRRAEPAMTMGGVGSSWMAS